MTVIVQSGTNLGLAKGQNRVTFRNPRGLKRYYTFYVTNGVQGLTPATVSYRYSTDGITWVVGGGVIIFADGGVVATVDAFDVKMHDDGSQLEVWIAAVGYDGFDTDYQTKYKYGTIADTASTISWSAQQDIDAAITTNLTEPHCIALARTDNGRIVVAFTEDSTVKGKDYRLTKLIGSDGDGATPSWSGETTWDDSSANSNNQDKDTVWFGLENYDSSYPNRVFLYAKLPEPSNPYGHEVITAVPDWNGTAFSNTTQASWTSFATDQGDSLSALIDDSDIAQFVYYRTGSGLVHRKAGSAGDDNLGSETTIRLSTFDAITITLDTGPATDLLYVFYHNTGDTVDFNYKTSPVGTISWSSEKTVSYHQNIIALSSWNRQIENSLHVAGLYGTTVIYNEHPVYKALSTTLADLEFPDQNYYLGPHSV